MFARHTKQKIIVFTALHKRVKLSVNNKNGDRLSFDPIDAYGVRICLGYGNQGGKMLLAV